MVVTGARMERQDSKDLSCGILWEEGRKEERMDGRKERRKGKRKEGRKGEKEGIKDGRGEGTPVLKGEDKKTTSQELFPSSFPWNPTIPINEVTCLPACSSN